MASIGNIEMYPYCKWHCPVAVSELRASPRAVTDSPEEVMVRVGPLRVEEHPEFDRLRLILPKPSLPHPALVEEAVGGSAGHQLGAGRGVRQAGVDPSGSDGHAARLKLADHVHDEEFGVRHIDGVLEFLGQRTRSHVSDLERVDEADHGLVVLHLSLAHVHPSQTDVGLIAELHRRFHVHAAVGILGAEI